MAADGGAAAGACCGTVHRSESARQQASQSASQAGCVSWKARAEMIRQRGGGEELPRANQQASTTLAPAS